MLQFGVTLIKVPQLRSMTGVQVFDLMVNARHVAGRYWIFEGDEDALLADVTVVSSGITGGHGDMDDDELKAHCKEVFGIDLSAEPPTWKMIDEEGGDV